MSHGQLVNLKHPTTSRHDLDLLLARRNEHPEQAPQIDDEIRRRFVRPVTIFVLDMAGFSRLTAVYGIIHYLAMIHTMRESAIPTIHACGGSLIKPEADNLFAIFPEPAQALEAAKAIFHSLDQINKGRSISHSIWGSVGIGYGDAVVVGAEDLFGMEMNLACKLGEDLADAMEVLLTPAAYQRLPQGVYDCSLKQFSVSKMTIDAYHWNATTDIESRQMPV